MRSIALTCFVLLYAGTPTVSGQNPDSILSRARVAALNGRGEESRQLYAQALEGYRAAGDAGGQGTVKTHLSDLAIREQNPDRAIQLRREAYDLFRSAKLGFSQALTLRELALIYFVKEDFSSAEELC